MERMAKVVDNQNAGDADIVRWLQTTISRPRSKHSLDLVHGCRQPSGYTEPVLHRRRLELKQSVSEA